MNKTSFLPVFLNGIPPTIKVVLLRMLIIFIAWKLVYNLILSPFGIPDRQLTILTAKTTSLFFNSMHSARATFENEYNGGDYKTIFFIDGQRAIGIADRCNALELMVLYVGFLFCIPYKISKQVLYAVAGLIVIFILNISRCYALARLNLNHSPLADVAHKYIFTMIIYSLIFITWIKYSRPYFDKE